MSNASLEPSKPSTVPDVKCEKGTISSLSAIALEYENSNSDVEEIADTNKTENQSAISIPEKQTLILEYENSNSDVEEIEANTNKIENQSVISIPERQTLILEYENSNSDVEEIEADTNKTENQGAISIPERQTLILEYENSNSVVEEIEADTNKTENQGAISIPERQTLILEYENSNSDVEEIEADTNKTENQSAISIPKRQILQQYRTIEENVLSSCEETDSEDDSSSSCSSSSSSASTSDNSNSDNDSDDITSANNNNKKKNGNKTSTTKKKKQIENEFDDLPPIEDLKISVPEVLCDLLGEVDKIVEQLVIVKPKPNKPALHVDTVLFLEKGERALGKILDVFGPVSEPNYCIRFNNSEHIQESNIKVGMSVYYCPNTEYTSLIFLHELNKMKSYDAVGDDEPPEFSDDEEERAYYEKLKQKNNKDNSDGSVLRKRQRVSNVTQKKSTAEWQSNPWNRNTKFQRKNQERQQVLRNNSHFNPSQYGPHSYNDSWQYQYQNNMHWPPVPRNVYPMHPMFNRPSFNESGLSQCDNYNSNSSGDAKQYYQGTTPNYQCNITPQYPRIPFGASPTFPPPFPMNYPQFPNASFSYVDMSYPISARPPMHTNTLWSPLPPPPPPPPPSTDSTTVD